MLLYYYTTKWKKSQYSFVDFCKIHISNCHFFYVSNKSNKSFVDLNKNTFVFLCETNNGLKKQLQVKKTQYHITRIIRVF